MRSQSKKNTNSPNYRVYAISITILFALTLILSSFFTLKNSDDEESAFHELFKKNYSIFALDMPRKLEFAGEKVPLDFFDVRESLDRELLINTYWQSQTLLLIKKTNRYFPLMEPILKENGIPDDFKYLPVAESGLANVVSPAHAVGFWQLLEGTARDYGLEVDDQVDERYSIERSTEAACKYLKESYEKYGSWTMVAASYNAGRRGIDKQIDRQKTDNYYNLLLNEETARYIFRILAFKSIITHPEKYGFQLRQEDLYPVIPVKKLEVDTTVNDFATFAAKYNTNYKILKYLNPWLRQAYLINKDSRKYLIKIPQEGARSAATFQLSQQADSLLASRRN